jgi:hypothetical protein
MLTTVGNSLSARSAKESGAGRAKAGARAGTANSAKMAQTSRTRRLEKAGICSFLGTEKAGIGGQFRQQKQQQTGKTGFPMRFFAWPPQRHEA